MAGRVTVRHIKAHRTYEIAQAAAIIGVTPQTIRAYQKRGPRVMTEGRPYLILGADLKAFVEKDRKSGDPPPALGEFKCLRCKANRNPAFGLADYKPLTPSRGILSAFCDTCEGRCTRFVSSAALPSWQAILTIGGTFIETP